METKSKSIEKVSKPEAIVAHRGAGTRQWADANPQMSGAFGVQSAAGNLAVQRMFRNGILQSKLMVGSPNDPLEDEADRVAEQVIQTKAEPCNCGGRCAECQDAKEGMVQPKLTSARSSQATKTDKTVSDSLHDHLGSGNALDLTTRSFFETRFNHDFSDVRVHTDEQATRSAQSLNARAYTVGKNVVFGAGHYAPGSGEGKRLLAHELTHVVQQKGSTKAAPNGSSGHSTHSDHEGTGLDVDSSENGGGIAATTAHSEKLIQRAPLDPANEAAWSFLSTESRRQTFSKVFLETLSAAPEAGLRLAEEMRKSGPPSTDEQKEMFEQRLEMLIRLTALGLMASHRATITSRRQEMLDQVKQDINDKNPKAPSSEEDAPQAQTAQTIRTAAEKISLLNHLKDQLEGYRDNLHIVEVQAIISMRTLGRIEEWLNEIYDNSIVYRSPGITQAIRNSIEGMRRVHTLDETAPFLTSLAEFLKNWRQKQVDAVDISLRYIYEAFPFFAQLEAEDVVKGDQTTDKGLMKAVQDAYDQLVEKIDIAIVTIGSGDIHPFDLPLAVQDTRTWLAPELRPYIDQAQEHRQVIDFWKSMGLTFFQALLVFLPVVGPFMAAGVGVYQLGSSIEDMLNRQSISEASASPDKEMLGVSAPSRLEWAMRAVELALTIVDLRSALHEVRGSGEHFDAGLEGSSKRAELKEGEMPPETEGTPGKTPSNTEPGVAHPGEPVREPATPISETEKNILAGAATRSGEELTLVELDTELDIVARKPGRPINEGGYVEEVELPNGHRWRRHEDGHWCRFSDGPFCVRARFRANTLESFTIEQNPELARLRRARSSALTRARTAVEEGELAKASRLRSGTASRLSEQIGEEAADIAINKKFSDLVLKHRGSGPKTLDLVYEHGDGFIVVEAKGGAGKLGTAETVSGRAQQGTKVYLRQKIFDMLNNPEENELAQSLLDALNKNEIRYFLSEAPISSGTKPLETSMREFLVR